MSLFFVLGPLTTGWAKLCLDNENSMVNVIADSDHEGTRILSHYTVLGRYDCVVMVEADDNEAMAKRSLV